MFFQIELSVRFSSRHSLLQSTITCACGTSIVFQSAFHRGIHCYFPVDFIVDVVVPFSPLFIAAFTATSALNFPDIESKYFQSAFHRGIHCYCLAV